MNRYSFALVFLFLFSAVFSVSTSVVMFPSSNSYILRTYTIESPGLFSLEPSEIKGVAPSSMSIFTEGASIYLTYYREVNKTRQVQKSFEDMLNESVGSQVSVHVSPDKDYNGTLQWYNDGYIGLADGTKERVISLSNIVELLMPQVSSYKDENYTEYLTTLFGSSTTPSSRVSLGYATTDLSWSIDYDLAVNSGNGRLTQYAELANNGGESYDNAQLTLTMLAPNFVNNYYRYNYNGYNYNGGYSKSIMYESALPQGVGGAPSFEPVSQQGFWSYKADKPITLPPHSSQKLAIFTDDAKYEKKYVWDTSKGDTAYVVYDLNNTRDEVLPSGTVRVFEDGCFMGEDSIGLLASGKDEELFVSNAPQFSVEKSILSDKTSGFMEKYTHTVTIRLKVKNYGKEATSLEVRDYIPQYDDFAFVSFSVEPYKIDVNKAVWVVDVGAGAEKMIEYTYTYTSRY